MKVHNTCLDIIYVICTTFSNLQIVDICKSNSNHNLRHSIRMSAPKRVHSLHLLHYLVLPWPNSNTRGAFNGKHEIQRTVYIFLRVFVINVSINTCTISADMHYFPFIPDYTSITYKFSISILTCTLVTTHSLYKTESNIHASPHSSMISFTQTRYREQIVKDI